jgi:hypothetical protein
MSVAWFKGSTFEVQRLDNSKNKSNVRRTKESSQRPEPLNPEPLNLEN